MKVHRRINFTEVIRELDYKGLLQDGTAIVTDFDNTLISYADAAKSLLALKPDQVPDSVMTQIHKIVKSGTKLAIATNRPDEGFTIARAMQRIIGEYPVFPKTLEDMGVEVFGGGPLFMLGKYKTTDDAHYLIESWLLAAKEDGGAGITDNPDATIVFVGDRPWDLRFFAKLEESLINSFPNIAFIGFKLPGFQVEDKRISNMGWWLKLKVWLVGKLP